MKQEVVAMCIGAILFALAILVFEMVRSRKPKVVVLCSSKLNVKIYPNDDSPMVTVPCQRQEDHNGLHAGTSGASDYWWQPREKKS